MKTPWVFEQFDQSGIRYCHWKSNEHVLAGLEGKTDLDILIEADKIDRVHAILSEGTFRQVFSPKYARHPDLEDWIGMSEQQENLLHIHLHTKLVTGKRLVKELYLPYEQLMLERRIMDPEAKIFVADPTLERLLLNVRLGAKWSWFNRTIPQQMQKEMSFLDARINPKDLEELTSRLFQTQTAPVILSKTPQQMHTFVHKQLRNQLRHHPQITGLLRLVRMAQSRFFPAKKRLHPVGIVIAIIGPDGAGKSTCVEALTRWLGWKCDVKQMYFGWDLGGLSRKKTKKTSNQKLTRQKKPFKTHPMWIRNGLAIISAWNKVKKIKQIKRLKKMGWMIVTDRFPQMQFRGINDGPLIESALSTDQRQRWLEKMEQQLFTFMTKTCPPDLVIKLSLSPEVAHARKPDHQIETIRKKQKIVKELHFEQSRIVEIDASMPFEQVMHQMKKFVWMTIAKQNQNYTSK